MNCPNCNSLNPDDAEWCSLCLTRFEEPLLVPKLQPTDPQTEQVWQSIAGEAPGPQGHDDPAPPPQRLQSGPIVRTERGLIWSCPSCDNKNDLEQEICPVCGTSFYDAFKPPEEAIGPNRALSSQVAALLSLIPGAGHIYAGRVAEGVTRLFLATWWTLTIILVPASLPMLALTKIVYVLALMGLMAISAVEASRAAVDPRSISLLSTRAILYASMSLVGVLVISSVAASVALRR